MFYCDECARKKGWPESFLRSHGRCEVCKETRSCNDVHHSQLPSPPVQMVMPPPRQALFSDAAMRSLKVALEEAPRSPITCMHDEILVNPGDPMKKIFDDIKAERLKQISQWGGAAHDDRHTSCEWAAILSKHVGKYADISLVEDGKGVDLDEARKRLVAIAAIAVAAIEAIDRRQP